MKIAVIGGGASGLMAACTAAKEGAQVVLYEKNERVGKKILSTGNGKCNFTNLDMDETKFYADDKAFVKDVLVKFSEKDTITFFENAGMLSRQKNGYLYPLSEQASTVLDIFRFLLKKYNVTVKTSQKVISLNRGKKGELIIFTENGSVIYDKVIVACGGMAAPKSGSDGNGYALLRGLGHTIHRTVPALVQLKVKEPEIKAIAGVRNESALTLFVDDEKIVTHKGEVQFTDYGISGIVTFQISRIAAYALADKRKVEVCIDLVPDRKGKELEQFMLNKIEKANEETTLEDIVTGMVNKKLMLMILTLHKLKPSLCAKKMNQHEIKSIVNTCKKLCFTIKDTNSFEQAQVTAGGIPLSEITGSFESCLVKNCFIVGELLDVDGICGGYNLQWAWSSGYIAGLNASK